MKRFFTILLCVSLCMLLPLSCSKTETEGADLWTLSLSYDTDGNTLPTFSSEGGEIEKSVVINQGGVKRDLDWTVSVDNAPSWISVTKTRITRTFKGTYGGDDATVTFKALKINVSKNDTGLKRVAVIRFRVADGGTVSTLVNQSK